MNKKLLSVLFALIPGATLFAGGLTTNTNQNAAYLRQMSQEAIIDITGLYMNPAGTAFLAPGYHFSLNIQSAKQDRDIETTFPLMQYSRKNPTATRLFHGEGFQKRGRCAVEIDHWRTSSKLPSASRRKARPRRMLFFRSSASASSRRRRSVSA